MRSLRYFLGAMLVVAIACCSLMYTSCKNKCGNTTCQNGGSCSNNVCVCPTGYSGSACDHGWSDAAIGTYTCTRASCSPAVSGASTWQSSITKDATNGGFTVDISNFNNSNTSVIASIDSATSGTTQRISIAGAGTAGTGTNASGTLTIVNSVTTVSLHFTTYTGGIAGSSCEMTLRKL